MKKDHEKLHKKFMKKVQEKFHEKSSNFTQKFHTRKNVPGTLKDSNIISAKYSLFSGGLRGGSVSRK